MKVRMLVSESAKRYPTDRAHFFRRMHSYDVPAPLADAWEQKGVAYKLPEGVEDDLPDGYEMTGSGGYYRLTAPDGSEVEGPENGRFRGKDTTVTAAHQHDDRHDFAPETIEDAGDDSNDTPEHDDTDEG